MSLVSEAFAQVVEHKQVVQEKIPGVLPPVTDAKHILLAIVLPVLVLYLFLAGRYERRAKSSFPQVGIEKNFWFFNSIRQRLYFRQHGKRLIEEAWAGYRDSIVTLPNRDRTSIMLPPRYLEEIKALPKSTAWLGNAITDGQWTTLDPPIFGHANVQSIKTQYISRIGTQVEDTGNEVDHAFDHFFGTYQDITPVQIQPQVMGLVAQVIARTVIGRPICRDAKWISAVIDYAVHVFLGAMVFKLVPPILQPIAALFSTDISRIRASQRTIWKFAAPIFREKIAWKQSDPESWKAHMKEDRLTAVDFLVDASTAHESNPKLMVHRLTGLSFGSTNATSAALTNALLDLATDFERWGVPMREEIESILGTDPKDITHVDLQKLWKMDSFLKESQRFHPPGKLSVNRKMMQDYKLSSGEVLPKNSHISFAGVPMAFDDEYMDNPAEFDGFRFERLRRDAATDHNGLQFTSSYTGALHFGMGRDMCPGRFLGSSICKLILIKLILRYDLKIEGGQRPVNHEPFDMDFPDRDCEVIFRDRTT